MSPGTSYAKGYASFRTLDPELQFKFAPMHDLLARWHGWRGKREMPARRDFEPWDLKGHLGWIALIDVEHDPERYRFRLVGADIAIGLSRDSTGMFLEDVYGPEFYDVAVGSYRWNQEHRRPVRAYGEMVHARKGHIRFESLDLPFSSSGIRVDLIMKRVHYSSAISLADED
ncbi:MAG: PAS domain-containing protein [Minwuia sp.]|nr:PAS domain-containing protein [Minwuia sp.]